MNNWPAMPPWGYGNTFTYTSNIIQPTNYVYYTSPRLLIPAIQKPPTKRPAYGILLRVCRWVITAIVESTWSADDYESKESNAPPS
jgi:hypothetical protein